MNEHYRHYDTRRANGVYVTFHLETAHDDCADRPDERDDGFWPSRVKTDAGYVPPAQFAEAERDAKARMHGWTVGDWHYMGVRVRAEVEIIRNGHGITHTLTSAGLWGVDSDCGDSYLAEIYADEVASLIDDMDALGGGKLPRSYVGARTRGAF